MTASVGQGSGLLIPVATRTYAGTEDHVQVTEAQCFVSELNSTQTALGAGGSFTGESEFNHLRDVEVTLKTDVAGTLYVEFSIDGGANWDTSIALSVDASTGEYHVLEKNARACRIRYVNGSAAQGYLRLQTSFGAFRPPTSGLNSTIQQDADAQTVRTIGEESFTSEGKFAGRSFISKRGRNPAFSNSTTPEDVWNGGGVYAGFPVGDPEEIQIVCVAGDVGGTVTFQYLASSSSTAYAAATVTLTGTTTNTGVTAWRIHTASFSRASNTAFNTGEIQIRHRTTTANVFIRIPTGYSQSFVAAYTVPAGHKAYLDRLFVQVQGSGSGDVGGGLWVRSLGESPRIRRPFLVGPSAPYEEQPKGGLSMEAGTDITWRLLSGPVQPVVVVGGFDIRLIKQ